MKIPDSITSIISRLMGSAFVRSFLTLVSGNGAAQLVNLATIPIITRLYQPNDLGGLALFTASVLILASTGPLRFELAMMLPADQKEAHNLLFLAGLALLTTSGLTTIVLFFAGSALVSAVGMPSLAPLLFAIPIGMLIFGLKNLAMFYRLRSKAFTTIATERVINVAVCHTLQITFAVVYGSSTGALIGSFLLAVLVGTLLLWGRPKLFPFREFLSDIRPKNLLSLISSYREFPLFSTMTVLLGQLSRTLTLFLISYFFTPAIVGLYSLANRVLFQPLYLFSGSMQAVLLQSSSNRLQTHTPIRSVFRKSVLGLAVVGVLPSITLILAGPWLFALVFGAEWRQAGEYARVLSPLFFLLLATAPANQIFVVTRRQSLVLRITAVTVFAGTAAIAFGALMYQNVVASLILYSITHAIMRIVFVLTADHLAKNNDRQLLESNANSEAMSGTKVDAP